MSVKIADVVSELKKVLAGERPAREKSGMVHAMVADFLIRALVRDQNKGKAAVLRRLPDDVLTFTYPDHLVGGNVLNIDRLSIAGRTVLDQRTMIENNLAEEEHKAFFERIPDAAGSIVSIQKMVAAPMVDREGTVVGVVEVSRAGVSLAEAGPDFTARDAGNLEKSCKIFAPYLAHVWTLG